MEVEPGPKLTPTMIKVPSIQFQKDSTYLYSVQFTLLLCRYTLVYFYISSDKCRSLLLKNYFHEKRRSEKPCPFFSSSFVEMSTIF